MAPQHSAQRPLGGSCNLRTNFCDRIREAYAADPRTSSILVVDDSATQWPEAPQPAISPNATPNMTATLT